MTGPQVITDSTVVLLSRPPWIGPVYVVDTLVAAAVRQQLVARIELEKLAHVTELLEQLQCILQP